MLASRRGRGGPTTRRGSPASASSGANTSKVPAKSKPPWARRSGGRRLVAPLVDRDGEPVAVDGALPVGPAGAGVGDRLAHPRRLRSGHAAASHSTGRPCAGLAVPVASRPMLHGLRRRASGHRHLLTGSAALVLTAGVQALSGRAVLADRRPGRQPDRRRSRHRPVHLGAVRGLRRRARAAGGRGPLRRRAAPATTTSSTPGGRSAATVARPGSSASPTCWS